jgi:hypothetical protein
MKRSPSSVMIVPAPEFDATAIYLLWQAISFAKRPGRRRDSEGF